MRIQGFKKSLNLVIVSVLKKIKRLKREVIKNV